VLGDEWVAAGPGLVTYLSTICYVVARVLQELRFVTFGFFSIANPNVCLSGYEASPFMQLFVPVCIPVSREFDNKNFEEICSGFASFGN